MSLSEVMISARLFQCADLIAWSRTGDPELGDWQPAIKLFRTGTIPDEFDSSGDGE
jgi:hypothetical protein